MSEIIPAIRAALEDAGAKTHFEARVDRTYCANLGNDDACFVENAALTDLAAVEDFFREQAAIHFPDMVLP